MKKFKLSKDQIRPLVSMSGGCFATDMITVEGTAGGGMVSVTLTAKGDLKGVRIDDSLLKAEEKEILEDLLIAAHADARKHAEAVMQEKMKSLTGGLPLPPGLGLG